ncbi:interferon alpha-inducible protein 6 isoform X2 [Saimiri boliviensis]|uniref:interferon alpha-inducible protein 6 isoform X2 n=1 Tax=Saimiri boliviensis TaxID=27679 RepID=UPI003D773BB8
MIKSQPSAREPFTRRCAHLSAGSGQEDCFSSLLQGAVTEPARGATMRQKAVSLFLCYLLLFTCSGVEAGKKKSSEDSGSGFWNALTYMTVGGGLAVAALPALGFTGAGIAANSMAASLMSWSAIANGGGVPAGGLVATLQSLGAGGSSVVLGKIGALLGYATHKYVDSKEAEDEE